MTGQEVIEVAIANIFDEGEEVTIDEDSSGNPKFTFGGDLAGEDLDLLEARRRLAPGR